MNLKSSYIFAGMKKNRSKEAVFPTIETSYGIGGGTSFSGVVSAIYLKGGGRR